MQKFIITDYPNAVFEGKDASLDKLDEVIEWLSSVGVRSAATRLIKYKLFISDFYRVLGTEEATKDHLHQYAQAQREVFELIRLMETLQLQESSNLLQRLKQITSGLPFRSAQTHDPARDISFELSIAGRFLKAGLEVDLSQVADVVVRASQYTIYVECKRITSERQLEKRIAGAYQQAFRRIASSNSTKAKGFCAFEVSEIISPQLEMYAVTGPREFQSQTSRQLAGYVLNKRPIVQRHRKKGVLGSLFQYIAQGYSINEDTQEIQLTNNRGASFLPTTRTTSEANLVDSFLEKLSNQGMKDFIEHGRTVGWVGSINPAQK